MLNNTEIGAIKVRKLKPSLNIFDPKNHVQPGRNVGDTTSEIYPEDESVLNEPQPNLVPATIYCRPTVYDLPEVDGSHPTLIPVSSGPPTIYPGLAQTSNEVPAKAITSEDKAATIRVRVVSEGGLDITFPRLPESTTVKMLLEKLSFEETDSELIYDNLKSNTVLDLSKTLRDVENQVKELNKDSGSGAEESDTLRLGVRRKEKCSKDTQTAHDRKGDIGPRRTADELERKFPMGHTDLARLLAQRTT